MDQLMRITFHRDESLYLRWPYHATVIKTFDTVRRATVFISTSLSNV